MLNAALARKIAKIVAMTVAGLLVLLILIFAALLWVLHSPSTQGWALGKVRAVLAENGIELNYQSFHIAPFSGLAFDSLRIELSEPLPAQGQIAIERLRVAYSLRQILSREITLEDLTIAGMTGELWLELPASEPKAEEPATESEPFDLIEFLRSPPARLHVKQVQIDPIALTIHLSGPELAGKLQLDDFGLGAAMTLTDGQMQASWSTRLALLFDLQIQSPESQLATQGNLFFDHAGQASASADRQSWQHNVELERSQLRLENFGLQTVAGEDRQQISLASLRLDNQLMLARPQLAYNYAQRQQIESFLPLFASINGEVALQSFALKNSTQHIQLPQLAASWRLAPEIHGLDQGKLQVGDGLIQLNLANLRIDEGRNSLLRLASVNLNTRMADVERGVEMKTDLRVNGLRAADLKQNLDIIQSVQIKLLPETWQIQMLATTDLNQIRILDLELRTSDLRQNANFEILTKLNVPERLKALHEGAAILGQLGDLNLDIKQKLQVYHDQALWEVDWAQWQDQALDHDLSLSLKQRPPRGEALVRLAGLQMDLASKLRQGQLASQLDLDIKGLAHEQLSRPADLKQSLNIEAKLTEAIAASIKGVTEFGGRRLVDMKIDLNDEPRALKARTQLKIDADPSLAAWLEPAEILRSLGRISIDIDQSATLSHQASSIQAVDFAAADYQHDIQSEVQVKMAIDSKRASEDLLVELPRGLELKLNARILNKALQADTRVDIPQVRLPETAAIHRTRLVNQSRIPDFETLARIDSSLQLDVERFELLLDLPDRDQLNELLKGFQTNLKLTVIDQQEVRLDSLAVKMSPPLLDFSGQGDATASGSGEFQGALNLELPGAVGESTMLAGRLQVPITASLFDQNKVSLFLRPSFEQINIDFATIKLRGLDGSMSIREELSLGEDGSIDFLYYEDYNPFARVDFDSVEPLIGDRLSFGFDYAALDHIELGPLLSNFEIRQNLILLNDLRLSLLGGSALGRMYINLNGANPQFGFLGRFTQLDPRLLLPPEQRGRDSGVISGRSALVFDIRQRLATGRIDITSIGRDQLLRLIDMIDPNFEDPQLGAARKALYVAYPRKVVVDMNAGMMDLEIHLGGVLSHTISVRSLPLTPLIIANADEPLSALERILSATGDES